jgi:uncharacterized protein (TIGR03382 family)
MGHTRTLSLLRLISRTSCVALLVALTPIAALAALVPVGPVGTLTVDGQDVNIPISQSPGKLWGFGTWDSEINDFTGWSHETSEYALILSGTLDPDPSISYGISVTDFGAPSGFGFLFSTPIIFTAVPNLVNSSVAGALNDNTGNGISITPTLADDDGDALAELQIAELSVGGPFTNMGIDVGLANAHGPGLPGAFYTYGPYAEPSQPGPIAAWSTLQIRLGFTLSGGSDIAVLTGRAEIVVPEPSSIMLALVGAVGLAWQVRRRRSR